MEKIIEINGLKKNYGSLTAVDGIDLHVDEGQLYAFLGPNGAGKSTTINILCTFLKPDAGVVRVNGHELGREDDAVRGSIGVVFQEGMLDDLLTVEENLKVRGQFYSMSGETAQAARREAVEAAGVAEVLRRPYGKLSGGQRRRADIARALVHRPRILILDEPTTGLDPQTRQSVWDMIRRLQRENGMTVFLTTHYMEEAAGADYVTVIERGKIAAAGTPVQLKEKYARDCLRLSVKEGDRSQVEAVLKTQERAYVFQSGVFTVELGATVEALPVIQACGDHFTAFEVLQGTMDDAFIHIIGKSEQKEGVL